MLENAIPHPRASLMPVRNISSLHPLLLEADILIRGLLIWDDDQIVRPIGVDFDLAELAG